MTEFVPTIQNGLDVPISGTPKQVVSDGPQVSQVALLGEDYIGMKPTMLVREGDTVKLGQPLFEDKKTPGVSYTSPAAGKVAAIQRGAKRKFESIVIDVADGEEETFEKYDDHFLANLERDAVVQQLVASGMWSSFRTRPYSKVPAVDGRPKSIFVTAIDTNPLAADPQVVLEQPDYERYFVHGLQAISTLTEGAVYLCRERNVQLPGREEAAVTDVAFDGPHPAGLAGTHIHMLDPVNESKTVWHIYYQDVVAIGHLFLTGKLMTERIIALGGPAVKEPRLLKTRLGASLDELTAGAVGTADPQESEANPQAMRVISGSVLSGRTGVAPTNYLGRYHWQVSILREGSDREFVGWMLPGFDKFSITRAFASALTGLPGGTKAFTTSTEGSVRAVVPIGMYEKVMPLDIIATPLLKALLVQDSDTAQQLGCLELDEEDLSLCTFVCPGKNEYGPLLRQTLTHIEREG